MGKVKDSAYPAAMEQWLIANATRTDDRSEWKLNRSWTYDELCSAMLAIGLRDQFDFSIGLDPAKTKFIICDGHEGGFTENGDTIYVWEPVNGEFNDLWAWAIDFKLGTVC